MYNSLFQDDFAKELRDVYSAIYSTGTPETAVAEMMAAYADFLQDEDDAPIFWLTLAHEQWMHGCLTPEVRQQADYWSKHGALLRLSPAAIREVIEKIDKPVPPPKKTTATQNVCRHWENGDVFRYRLSGSDAVENGVENRTVFVQKIGSLVDANKTYPIVWIKIAHPEDDGSSLEAFRRAEFIPLYSFDDDYLSMERIPSWEKRPEYAFHREQHPYAFDSNHRVPVYRCWLILRKMDLKKFVFLGNDPTPVAPQNEYIPAFEIELNALSAKYLDKDIIGKYLAHKKY